MVSQVEQLLIVYTNFQTPFQWTTKTVQKAIYITLESSGDALNRESVE